MKTFKELITESNRSGDIINISKKYKLDKDDLATSINLIAKFLKDKNLELTDENIQKALAHQVHVTNELIKNKDSFIKDYLSK